MSMKQEGQFVARGLGFRGAEFERLLCPLTEEKVRRWDDSSRLWERLWLLDPGPEDGGVPPGTFKSLYFGALLRFYRSLLVSEKQMAVARAALHARDVEGMSVVIGIQTTGEREREGERERGREREKISLFFSFLSLSVPHSPTWDSSKK